MRVLIATDAWHPQVNGVVRTLTSLARAAKGLGVDIEFLSFDGFPTFPLPPYPGLRLIFSGFFDALLARPQVAALLLHEALGDTELAIPAGADEFLDRVRALYERGQAEGVFGATPFPIAYLTTVSSLVALAVVGPRMGTIAEQDHDLREYVVGQLLDGMTI